MDSFAWGLIMFLIVKEKPFQFCSSKDVITSLSQDCKVSKLCIWLAVHFVHGIPEVDIMSLG